MCTYDDIRTVQCYEIERRMQPTRHESLQQGVRYTYRRTTPSGNAVTVHRSVTAYNGCSPTYRPTDHITMSYNALYFLLSRQLLWTHLCIGFSDCRHDMRSAEMVFFPRDAISRTRARLCHSTMSSVRLSAKFHRF